ncbi:mCG1030451, isoform CRA_b [Mus musculus]|nr:mCG1030451, isoform CRA_b [Mus musculus]
MAVHSKQVMLSIFLQRKERRVVSPPEGLQATARSSVHSDPDRGPVSWLISLKNSSVLQKLQVMGVLIPSISIICRTFQAERK